jgi:5-oxopent-3-ene-1,2,5-tricarboxylate decarboxylase / 2-hydroxyhepta-2,4-diene-1,7-dioate isomerase
MTAFSGHIYGVVLNDCDERGALAGSFQEAPYGKPPVAPVVFMKPRTTMGRWSEGTDSEGVYCASTTLALLFSQDASFVAEDQVGRCIGATALAIDLSLPQPNYYRPAVAFRNADGTLILGDWMTPHYPDAIDLLVDGKGAHSWQLSRLVRPVPALVSELSQFLTLKAGDVLLVGFAGNAPQVRAGQSLCVRAPGLPEAFCVVGGERA